MTMFEIHPQLQKDCHCLGQIESVTVLLHKNASLPWFILVPRTDVESLHDLQDGCFREVMQITRAMARYVQETYGCDRVNVASIGNIVSQLHIHVIGRWREDPCWPDVVWGNLQTERAYETQELITIDGRLGHALPGFQSTPD